MIRRAVLFAAALVAIAAPSAHAAFPGQNGKIAFNRCCGSNVYTMQPDGTGQTLLQPGSQPHWSPDGARLAFTEGVDAWVMNADGTGVTALTKGGDYVGQAAWSPYGDELALEEYIVNACPDPDPQNCPGDDVLVGRTSYPPGSHTGISGFEGAFEPEWSPDGTRIAVSRGSSSDIYIGSPAGGPLTHVTSGQAPAWSPDGSKLAFQRSGDVWVVNADGSGETQLAGTPEPDRDPAWSPDGTKIVFSSFQDQTDDEIYVMNADGTGAQRITDNAAADIQPDWQPIPINSYPRPKGATPLRTSLTTAYKPCAAPDRTHGPPLAFGSCSSPQTASDYLTVGTGDSNGKPALSEGQVSLQVLVGNPTTPADEADVAIGFVLTDVYTKAMVDYDGELRVRLALQITDKDNTPSPGGPGAATTTEIPIELVAPCSPTINLPDEGAYCSVSTSPDTLAPGSVKERRRTVWQVGRVEVYDGGADGDADTPSGDTLFATQGLFIP